MVLPQEVKVKLLFWYVENGRSVAKTQRKFKVHYQRKKAPDRNSILDIVKNMEENGSVGRRTYSERAKTARTPENIRKIKAKMTDSPHRSARRLEKETAISRTTVRRILLDDIGAFPYKIQMQQSQSPANQKKRVEYATYLSLKIEQELLRITDIHWSDEANFHLSGHVNRQNMRFWALEKPEPIAKRPLSTEKLVVWCAITPNRIIGPFFFEDEEGKALTVNQHRYLAMLKRYYLPNIRRHGEQDTITFHQDGAPPHYANLVRDWLEETFQGRVISRGFEDFWPPYSPDLNPCDFYLWGYLKSKVYRDPVPTTLEELRKNIRREIRRINEDTLTKVYDNVLVRIQRVLGRKGAWIEHLING